jgi:hypothetical protein
MATNRRGRTAGFKMPDEHRTKIKNSCILKALIEHVEGKREMSSSQVHAGLGLLKKCLPDLSNVTVSSDSDAAAVPVVFINRYAHEDGSVSASPPTPYIPRDYSKRGD